MTFAPSSVAPATTATAAPPAASREPRRTRRPRTGSPEQRSARPTPTAPSTPPRRAVGAAMRREPPNDDYSSLRDPTRGRSGRRPRSATGSSGGPVGKWTAWREELAAGRAQRRDDGVVGGRAEAVGVGGVGEAAEERLDVVRRRCRGRRRRAASSPRRSRARRRPAARRAARASSGSGPSLATCDVDAAEALVDEPHRARRQRAAQVRQRHLRRARVVEQPPAGARREVARPQDDPAARSAEAARRHSPKTKRHRLAADLAAEGEVALAVGGAQRIGSPTRTSRSGSGRGRRRSPSRRRRRARRPRRRRPRRRAGWRTPGTPRRSARPPRARRSAAAGSRRRRSSWPRPCPGETASRRRTARDGT